MPFSDVTTGDLSELWLDVGAGLVNVAEIDEMPDLPSGTRGTYETTHMKSGPYKEHKKLPRKDGDTVQIMGNYIIGSNAEVTLMAADAIDTGIPYKLVLAQGGDGWEETGTALFTDFKRSNPMEAKRRFTITAKWLNASTVAEAA